MRIWQPAACPAAPSPVAVTQERDILSGDDTKVAGPQGLPISMLLCVVNTGLNGGGTRASTPAYSSAGKCYCFSC